MSFRKIGFKIDSEQTGGFYPTLKLKPLTRTTNFGVFGICAKPFEQKSKVIER